MFYGKRALEQDYREGLAGGCGRHRERDLPKSRRQERVRVLLVLSCAAHLPLLALGRSCTLTYLHGKRELAVFERHLAQVGPSFPVKRMIGTYMHVGVIMVATTLSLVS